MRAVCFLWVLFVCIPLIGTSPVSMIAENIDQIDDTGAKTLGDERWINMDSKSIRQKRSLTRLRYKDCGNQHRAIRFDQLSIRPFPIQIPGLIDLRLKANVTRKLPSVVDVKVILKKKYFDTQWMPISCFGSFGSCRYKKLDTCMLTQELFGCPVRTGYHDIDQKFIIPDPGDFYLPFLEGEFKAIVRARHPKTRKELGCLMAHFSLKNRLVRSMED